MAASMCDGAASMLTRIAKIQRVKSDLLAMANDAIDNLRIVAGYNDGADPAINAIIDGTMAMLTAINAIDLGPEPTMLDSAPALAAFRKKRE